MATEGSAIPAIPPLDKYSLIGIWMETAIWGMNCIVFAVALFVLLKRHDKPRLLVYTSTLLFILGTVYVSLSLAQLLEAFIDIPQPPPPLYSVLYWLEFTNHKSLAKNIVYSITVLLQDLILIWRLYVVWGFNWKVVILPLMVEFAHTAVALFASISLGLGASLTDPRIVHVSPVGWSLELVVNVPVTLGIAGRLWYMGRKVDSISTSYQKYLSSIFTIVESGAILAAVTIVMLALNVSGSVIALNGIDIAVQLAVLTPLLIIARVGIGMVHGMPKAMSFAYPSTLGSSGAMELTKIGAGSRGNASNIMIQKHHETINDIESFPHKGGSSFN